MINIMKQIRIIIKTQERNQIAVSLTTLVSSAPTDISLDNGDIITNSCDVADNFNNYLTSISETTRKRA